MIVIDSEDEVAAAPPKRAKRSEANAFTLREEKGDLFSVPSTTSLAHCVAADFRLGKGVATAFRDLFVGLDELRNCGAGVGEVYTLRRGARFVYNLVTKPRSSGTKPTLSSMRAALVSLRARITADGVTTLAIPRIGCGLDGLVWRDVRALLQEVFAVCSLLSLFSLSRALHEDTRAAGCLAGASPPSLRSSTSCACGRPLRGVSRRDAVQMRLRQRTA